MFEDWHRWCEVWEGELSAKEAGFAVVGADDIREGDWFFSDGYLSPCDHGEGA